ncbi:MAG: type II toxin-antitoxin system RelE/ParE family toxin [Lachnospiraceae bacterium]|nr:type II toxin-antitoxin system RelE/ParE family toxin [Lachnospiraceae bacterium]
MYNILLYEKKQGNFPCQDFLDSLNPKNKAKAFRSIDLLEENGPHLFEPYIKHIESGLYELRIKHGSDIIRIFYFYGDSNTIILTNGFMKKAQKTPKSEINLARKYKKEYERRLVNEKIQQLQR